MEFSYVELLTCLEMQRGGNFAPVVAGRVASAAERLSGRRADGDCGQTLIISRPRGRDNIGVASLRVATQGVPSSGVGLERSNLGLSSRRKPCNRVNPGVQMGRGSAFGQKSETCAASA